MEYSEQYPNGLTVYRRGEDYVPPQPDYDPLALSVMSVIFEHDGEVKTSVLYERMKEDGIQRNRVTACIRNVLLKEELLSVENPLVITALERGTDYVNANLDRLDEAEGEALKTKRDIAKEASAKRAADAGTLPNELLLTAKAMSEEINRMRQALGEPERDTENIENKDQKGLQDFVAELTAEMRRLEGQLNSR